MHAVEVSSSPTLPLLFVIVFWDETNRSSLSQIYFKIGVLKNFANFIRKQQCWSLFLIKLQAWRPATLLKRDSNTGVFLWNLWNFLEHLFLQNASSGCFWSNSGDLCGSLCDTVILWSFSSSLSELSSIMLNLLTKSPFDISLFFKLKHAFKIYCGL